jgi:SAM-dependent methyltransferase
MYEAALDYWPAVQGILQTKLMCGSLRRLDHYRLPGNFRWHYSGTFFWFRGYDIQGRNPEKIVRKYIGTEAWPGGVARRDEAGVLFLDAMRHSLYDLPTMQHVVWPQWDAWKKQNHHQRTEDVMCSTWGVNFARYLPAGSIEGKDVVEVGARDVNGSCRPLIMQRFPKSYTSTDMDNGHGIDIVCSGQELPERIGLNAADVIVCTEVLEHVKDWREFIAAIWSVLRPGGVLLLTTRSPGFPYHEFPSDHWRFTLEDMLQIFSGQEIITVTKDPTTDLGVGVIVRKMSDVLGCDRCEPYAMVAPS